MKERPIIFSGDMVKAILDGRQTQTRRVITNIGGMKEFAITAKVDGREGEQVVLPPTPTQAFIPLAIHLGFTRERLARNCPYGNPGDRLWVREKCMYGGYFQGVLIKYAVAGGEYIGATKRIAGFEADPDWMKFRERYSGKWCSPILMPRWASRIILEITAVRVERLQDITYEDAMAEGIGAFTFSKGCLSDNPPDPLWKYIELWNSLNAKRGYSWDSNPWVWVLEFKRLPASVG